MVAVRVEAKERWLSRDASSFRMRILFIQSSTSELIVYNTHRSDPGSKVISVFQWGRGQLDSVYTGLGHICRPIKPYMIYRPQIY